MQISSLNALQAHDLAVVELRRSHPNMRYFGHLVERMTADGGNDERTWRYAGQLYEQVGWYEKALGAYRRCRDLGNVSATAAIERVQARLP